jgi:hypothetical protein
MITYFGEMWLQFEGNDERERTINMLQSNGYTVQVCGDSVCIDFARRSFGQMQRMLEVISSAECGVSSFRMIHE